MKTGGSAGKLEARLKAVRNAVSRSMREGYPPHTAAASGGDITLGTARSQALIKNTPPASGGSRLVRHSFSEGGRGESCSEPWRPASTPTLIAVTKSHPAEVIEEAIRLGVTDFGENKVQEARAKYPALKAKYPQIRLHLIGSLQTNKVKEALALFEVIHTVDRPGLVDAIMKEVARGTWCVMREEQHAPGNNQTATPHLPRRFLIQVNTGREPQKGGVLPEDLPALLDYCQKKGLPIAGLMCIPPHHEPPAPHFILLRQLAAGHGLRELSMGMSGDYEEAIAEGATMVRIGTALFGERG